MDSRDKESARTEHTRPINASAPRTVFHDQDINDFTDEPCAYLISLTPSEFKFYRTRTIATRVFKQLGHFSGLGLSPKIVKMWSCETIKAMRIIGDEMREFFRQSKIRVKKYDQARIIVTDKIDVVIKKIDECVREHSFMAKSHEKLMLERILLANEGKRLENERLKLELDRRRLELQARTIPVYQS